MAMTVTYMRALIRQNGHLVLEGIETRADLMEAIIHLWGHSYTECQLDPNSVAPMNSLIPDLGVVVSGRSMKKKYVSNVDTQSGRL